MINELNVYLRQPSVLERKHPVKTVRWLLCIIAFFVVILGCGDTDEDIDVLKEGAAVGIFADAKYPDVAPAAPAALPAGTPSVKEVSFYHDWKLTKPVTAPVSVGEQVFIHLTFSEPMKHVVSGVRVFMLSVV